MAKFNEEEDGGDGDEEEEEETWANPTPGAGESTYA